MAYRFDFLFYALPGGRDMNARRFPAVRVALQGQKPVSPVSYVLHDLPCHSTPVRPNFLVMSLVADAFRPLCCHSYVCLRYVFEVLAPVHFPCTPLALPFPAMAMPNCMQTGFLSFPPGH